MKKTQTVAFANLIGSIFFIILGIWAWLQTGKFEEVKNSFVQAATFPRVMIAGLLILWKDRSEERRVGKECVC